MSVSCNKKDSFSSCGGILLLLLLFSFIKASKDTAPVSFEECSEGVNMKETNSLMVTPSLKTEMFTF